MPRLIDPGGDGAITLGDLGAILADCRIDARNEDGFASIGPALARLARNPDFLADLAIRELASRCDDQVATNDYGAQVFLLRPSDGRFVVRANFWPGATDPAFRASGPAAFFYGMPHDHNFSFLTVGYLGPGYWSDHYEVDPGTIEGRVGEAIGMRFVERSRLDRGKLMLYRMRRDIHVQAPPDAFSVSINILGHDPAQPWTDQYRYDLESGTIDGILTTTPGEVSLTLATRFGDGNGIDLATRFALRHPCARMRVTAIDALAATDPDLTTSVLMRAADDPAPRVARKAREHLAALEASAPKRTHCSPLVHPPG